MTIRHENIYKKIIIIFCALVPVICFAEGFSPSASYEVCFTPGGNCANKIIETISQARKQVLVQAYAFTDQAIAQALVKVKKKGVEVRILLDKSQTKQNGSRSLIRYFKSNKIKPTIDFIPDGIAHNKIMIIDGCTVIGGSYNYTHNAARRNAENIIIIHDPALAKKYLQNWHNRERKTL
jgi:phospholipase D